MCGDIYAHVRVGEVTTQASFVVSELPYLEKPTGLMRDHHADSSCEEPMGQWNRLRLGADTGAKKFHVEAVCDRPLDAEYSLTMERGIAIALNCGHSRLQSRSDGR